MEVEDGATSSSLSLVSESHVHTPPQLDMAAGGGAWPYAPGTSRASIPSASTSSARSARSAHDTDEQLAASGGGTSAQSATESPQVHDLEEIVGALHALQGNDDKYIISVIRAHVDELFTISTDPGVISDRLAVLERQVLYSPEMSANLAPLFAAVRQEHSLPASPLYPDEEVTPSPTNAALPEPYSRSSSAPVESHHYHHHHHYHQPPHGNMGPPSRPHTQPRPRRQTDIMPSHWTFPPQAPHPTKRPRSTATAEHRHPYPTSIRRPRLSLSTDEMGRTFPPASGRVFGLGIPPASTTSPTEMNERLQVIEDAFRRARGDDVEMLDDAGQVTDSGPSREGAGGREQSYGAGSGEASYSQGQ